MQNNLCPQCGAPASAGTSTCEYCGAALQQSVQPQPQPQPQPQQERVVYVQQNSVHPERATWPNKSKIAAGILAILLGGIGVHKFYLGQTGKGVLYLLLCWTYIPALISFIEGIIILCSNDENFQLKYKCRIQ